MLETSQKSLAELTVVVDVPESVQLQRTMARDDNDEAQVRRIMDAQMKRADRLARADYTVDNSGEIEALDAQVEALHARFLEQVNGG